MKDNEYVKSLSVDNYSHILRVMRITIFILFVSATCAFSNSYSQQTFFSFEIKEKTIWDVFNQIENSSEYVFLFADELSPDLQQKVSVKVEEKTLDRVLDEVFKATKLAYKINDRQVLISKKETEASDWPNQPQNSKTIKGKVVDEDGEPLPGATVTTKSEPIIGTATNADGAFSIQIPEETEVLVVSFVGMKSQNLVLDEGKLLYNVVMDPVVNDISEVIATGYFVRKKDDFTGSAITVTQEELKTIAPGNVLQSLEAFDPSFKIVESNLLGSNPNRLPNINVRGASSIPAGSGDIIRRDNIGSNVNMPTFILDGYEVGVEKVYDLDINRIESITVLKDAAATAIYGSRAANGVVVITTVSPKEGELRVSYNMNINLSAPDLGSYNVLNAADKLEYERLAGLYEYNGSISQDELDELYNQKKYNVISGVNTYWLSQPVRNAVGSNHSLYIEGGSETIRYGVNLLYQNNPGVMEGSKRDRFGVGSDLSYNLNDKFLFKNNLSVTQVNGAESPYGSFAGYVRMNPYYPKTDENGSIIREIDSWTDRSGANGSESTEVVLNPLYEGTLNSFNKNKYTEIIDAFSVDWHISDALRVKGLMSLTHKQTEQDVFISPLSNYYYFYSTEDLDKRGEYDYSASTQTTIDGNITATYSKGFGSHFLNVALGANIRQFEYDLKGMAATGFSNDRLINIGFANGYKEDTTPWSSASMERLFGSFLNVNYSFKNKYLVDVSFRADGSSKFGSDNKVAPFYSMGVGWNLHRENFMKDINWLSQLRLKANTGLTGSVSFDPYMSNTLYGYYKDNWYSTGVGAIVTQYGNEDLKWQRTKTYDVQVDLGLLNDRLYFSGHLYNKLTEDMLTDITLPPSTGFSSYKANLGDIKNKGFEISTKLNVVKTKDWNVSLNGNFVHNENTLVKISNSLKAFNENVDEAQNSDDYKGVPLLRYNEGQSLNTIYAVRSRGIDPENGKEIFIKKDGTLTYDWDVADVVPIKDGTPTLEGYFGGSVYFKGFLLSCTFRSYFGGYNYNQTLVDRVENASPRYNVDERALENRWKQPGDVALYKDISDLGTTYVTERFIQKDNVLELNSVYFSYDFDKDWIKKFSLENLRAAITLNDVWRASSIDVERGIDYPFARNFTFSIQTTF
ncbi:SusC/RagA family TonB-linked outer membrane protein [uncultured Draconibacterium sp.]|uniref:SusC/RagA family TonB-linked outer membrane protein n=1 Tax=uncultured Draconibacterium sp. TaxID=1573823 RepID=UPI0029C7C655|nr:SusC/RagA family TonB-linked outer membrane protein [uncultured Draconibacterium sp.]